MSSENNRCTVCYKDVDPGVRHCSNNCWNISYITSRPVGNGWMPILWDIHNKINRLYPDYRIVQIKEKFGGLRFYVDGIDYWVEDTKDESEAAIIIRTAEQSSYETCEYCGDKPEPNPEHDGGWILTLCSACRTRRNLERAEIAKKWEADRILRAESNKTKES